MFLVSYCRCICPIHWGQVLSREWRYSWSNADRRCPKYIWVTTIWLLVEVRLILEVWQCIFGHLQTGWWSSPWHHMVNPKAQLETHGYVLSTVITDALVLKHQTSVSTDHISYLQWLTWRKEITFKKKTVVQEFIAVDERLFMTMIFVKIFGSWSTQNIYVLNQGFFSLFATPIIECP